MKKMIKKNTNLQSKSEFLKNLDTNVEKPRGVVNYLNFQIKTLDNIRYYFENEAILKVRSITDIDNNKIVKEMINSGDLEYIGRGILIDTSWAQNDFLIRQLVLKTGIYSGSTALYLWGLSDEYPYQSYMTFKRGYKLPNRLKEWTDGVVVRQSNPDILNSFVEKKSVEGTKYQIELYSKERALVDVLKEGISSDVINTAYRRYLKSDKAGVNKLLLTAKKLGSFEKVRNRLEIMI
ncbi:hypothetical protein FD31_GL001208 [Companilactobacillus nantensis DSM 16982]|uniref:Uncharacterized protein n=2 Tax=Companilactobacillus nantensis TaxID=305793 RepID=A0A0R1WDB0_9LACO|nr:hypothetical protein FD31_GL001208 [Companilactobacillus nantensis DSM 16982]